MSDRFDSNFFVNVFWFIWNTGFSLFDYIWIFKGHSNWLIWTGFILCGSVALVNFTIMVYKMYLIAKRISNEAKH